MENENITAVAEGKPSGYKVTKKDLRNANWRWLMSVCTFNYQTQQGASVAYALSPVLRKIYTNDEDYKQALNNHFRYYNTQPWLAAIILGACVAMEERDGLAAADAVQDLKIGTMGPLAGVGDSLLMTMIPTIMGSIAAYMAIEGNPVGAGIWFALILAVLVAPVAAAVQAIAHGWQPTGDDATIALRTAGILDGHLPATGMRSTSGDGVSPAVVTEVSRQSSRK